MLTNNHPVEQEELMAYLDGELSAERVAGAAEHLDHCRECQALAADFQGVSRRLADWQVAPPDQHTPHRIAAALNERPTARVRHAGRWMWGLASLCAVLLALISVSMPKMRMPSRAQLSAMQTPQRPASVELVRTHNPLIIRTSQLVLSTKEFDKARAALDDILKRHKGYAGQLNVTASAGALRTLDAILRVPADELEGVILEIKKLGRVESESRTGEEVTAQYIDLEARLANARNTEQRLTGLLRERTGKLADVLSVETEISRVRGEIERMEAEKKSLVNRVDFATLTVKLTEDSTAQLHMAPDSTLDRFRNAAANGYRSMAEGLVSVVEFLLSYGPSLLIWAAILFFPVRLIWRKLRRHPVR